MTDGPAANTAQWRSEADELGRVAAGDEAAFRRLYDAHHARVVRLAYGVLQDREAARDVAHDVMVKLLRVAADWEPRALIATWLRKVTLRECLSWRRRFLYRKGRIDDAAREEPPQQRAPDDDVALARDRRSLRAAMAELNARDRAILVLHVDEDLGPHEIAAALSIKEGAARVALHRAIERLRARMNTSNTGART